MTDTIVISNMMTDSAVLRVSPNTYEEKSLLSSVKKGVIYFYWGYNSEWDVITPISPRILSESYMTMLASEDVLRKEWDNPTEDEAWAHL